MYVLRIPRWVTQSAIGVCLVLSLTAVFAASSSQNKPAQGAATVPAQNGVCPAGYSGSAETGCVDVDECAAYNGGCHALTACENTAGSRTCGGCPEKFAGNGYIGCFDANECPNGDCSSRLPLGFEDAMPPVITTSGDVTVAATSAKGAVAKFTATAKDKIDGERPVACTPASGSTFPVGKTTVSCWSSNSLGKLKTSSLTVTVTK
jgi:HYR domain-containing protein